MRQYLLAGSIPLSVIFALVAHLRNPGLSTFVVASVVLIPLVLLTEDMTARLVPAVGTPAGALLNVTFGNLAQLTLAGFALAQGLHEVVKASIAGAIVSNILLGFGLSAVYGGLPRDKQTFSRTATSGLITCLFLSTAVMILPSAFQLIHGGGLPQVGSRNVDFGGEVEKISSGASLVLLLAYCALTMFMLKTHRGLLFFFWEEIEGPRPPVWRSVVTLGAAAALVALVSDILVDSIRPTAEELGVTTFFLAFIVVGSIGSVTAYALPDAAKDKMDGAVQITLGSSVQTGLVVAPLLVLLSFVLGPHPLGLVFNGYELIAMVLAVLAAAALLSDGETNWFEGSQFLAIYAVIGLVAFYA